MSDHSYIRTWNFPALAIYLTPLNGLYFSPYMSSLQRIVNIEYKFSSHSHLLTLSPLTASWLMEKWTLTLV